ncbi:MAG: toxin-antitoxin system HicB family antitoxin [Lachnospiraceae bacterium]|nr:toxin-antitoxin system HicB family antitoxin [Lachnospiraceae bacterium]
MKFKIKKQEYANRTFRLPVELLEELSKLAAEKNISLNQLIVQCCEFAIENIDEESEE